MNLLDKVIALEKDAAQFGFKWDNVEQIMEQIHNECSEVQEHTNRGLEKNKEQLQEEIGDLLHAVFSLSVYCQCNPAETLQLALSKFERRLNAVKQAAHEIGLPNLIDSSFEQRMDVWDRAKETVG